MSANEYESTTLKALGIQRGYPGTYWIEKIQSKYKRVETLESLVPHWDKMSEINSITIEHVHTIKEQMKKEATMIRFKKPKSAMDKNTIYRAR